LIDIRLTPDDFDTRFQNSPFGFKQFKLLISGRALAKQLSESVLPSILQAIYYLNNQEDRYDNRNTREKGVANSIADV
jgi:hypothetical protein